MHYILVDVSNMTKPYIYLGFNHGKLMTIIHSLIDEVENAIDMDYYISNAEDAAKQFEIWRANQENIKANCIYPDCKNKEDNKPFKFALFGKTLQLCVEHFEMATFIKDVVLE